jgi:hypothetical protein
VSTYVDLLTSINMSTADLSNSVDLSTIDLSTVDHQPSLTFVNLLTSVNLR